MASQTAQREHGSKLDDIIELVKTPKCMEEGFIERFYGGWTSTYDRDLKSANYIGPLKASLKMAELFSDKGISILDCASGTGLVGEALREQGFTNITAVDISQESLDYSAKKGCYSKFVLTACGDKNMPFDNDSYDALVAIACLGTGHVYPVALHDWTRVVKPGGFLVMTIRDHYLGEEYGVKYNGVVEELIQGGKLQQEEKTIIPNMWKNSNAYMYTFKVL